MINKQITMQELPRNIEAEKAVICGIIKATNRFKAIDDVSQIITANDFYSPANKLLFKAVLELDRQKKPIDEITLTEYLNSNGNLEKAGSIAGITDMMNSVISDVNIKAHANIVRENAVRRDYISACNVIKDMAYGKDDTNKIIETAEQLIFDVSKKHRHKNNILEMPDLMASCYESIDKRCENKNAGGLTGIDTGYNELNALTGGLQKSELIILGARPGMGKTTFALNIASNVALKDIPVAFFSLEMSAEQLGLRLISSNSYDRTTKKFIHLSDIIRGRLNEQDRLNLISIGDALSKKPLFIDDTAGINIAELRSRARQLKVEKNIQLLIIDYLQLLPSDRKRDNKVQEVADVSRQLKMLAKELNITVIALAQLSRALEARQDKRPLLSDLKESGAIEQDADIVMFLYRDGYYNHIKNENGKIDGRTDLIVAKHRNGETKTIKLFFNCDFCLFDKCRS
ncbi:replicative DNA helicase [Megamonas hypermegale]|uniref:replicative DNA helicase n=1 Tax=Megamonas hypermegale TaxID=158847 RepID=UPI0032092C8F